MLTKWNYYSQTVVRVLAHLLQGCGDGSCGAKNLNSSLFRLAINSIYTFLYLRIFFIYNTFSKDINQSITGFLCGAITSLHVATTIQRRWADRKTIFIMLIWYFSWYPYLLLFWRMLDWVRTLKIGLSHLFKTLPDFLTYWILFPRILGYV